MPMMKPRVSRLAQASGAHGSEGSARGSKSDSGITMGAHGPGSMGASSQSGAGGAGGQPGPNGGQAGGQAGSQQQQQQLTSAAQARKRRSSINVYEQPSSLNSRLRQLETDMLRLDEDRTKLFDDTHSALTQYEIRLGEIHAILKSRQDNVEKYVEDMKVLLQAKDEFERQTKLLHEKHERFHDKFMHRETIISREIKLLKNKFELLEGSRQFRLVQKSSLAASELTGRSDDSDLTSGLEAAAAAAGDELALGGAGELAHGAHRSRPSAGPAKSVRIRMSKLGLLGQLFGPLARLAPGRASRQSAPKQRRRKGNKVSSIMLDSAGAGELPPAVNVDAAAGQLGAARGSPSPPPAHKGASSSSGSLMSRLFSRSEGEPRG